MHPFCNSIGQLFLVLSVGLLAGGGCIAIGYEEARYTETRNRTVPHQPEMPVKVVTSNGSINVQQGQVAEVTIKAEIRAQTEQRLADTRIVAERRDGTLVVEVAWPNGNQRGNEGCSFEITVPDAKNVDAQTANGSIRLTGLAGKAFARTSNGSITITGHDGPVDADTGNGAIRIKAATGELIAKTSNGAIEIEDAKGRVDAGTSNARVKVRLADENPGPVRIKTSNGSIELAVGKRFAGELKMSTSNGGLHFTTPVNAKLASVHKNSARLIIGDSNTVSEVHTSNGSIDFREAE